MQLIAVDMDGTCLNSRNRISRRTMDLLREASRKMLVVITTGRCYSCLPAQIREMIDLFPIVITSNGARIIETRTGNTLFSQCIPPQLSQQLLSELNGQRRWVTLHLNRQYYVQSRLIYLAGKLKYGQDFHEGKAVRDLDGLPMLQQDGAEKIQVYYFNEAQKKRCEAAIRKYPDCSAWFSSHYVEITAKGVCKGRALSLLCQRLAIPRSQVGCIGDSDNDLSMFEASGFGCAMNNASSKLLEKADYITRQDLDHDGAAEALEVLLHRNGSNENSQKTD